MRPARRLRSLLAKKGAVIAPGVADALGARLVAHHGFDAIYMTGAGTTAVRLGMPDVGLLTMSEMADNCARIVDASALPLIADADTGYGGVLNVRRTVRAYECAGVAGLHIEDQVIPKRCGHLMRPDHKISKVSDLVTVYQVPNQRHVGQYSDCPAGNCGPSCKAIRRCRCGESLSLSLLPF